MDTKRELIKRARVDLIMRFLRPWIDRHQESQEREVNKIIEKARKEQVDLK
jgi:hypothetical protein